MTANHGMPWISPSLFSIREYTIVRARARLPLIMEHAWNVHVRVGRQAIIILDVNFLSTYVKANVAEAWSYILETGSVAFTTHLYTRTHRHY